LDAAAFLQAVTFLQLIRPIAGRRLSDRRQRDRATGLQAIAAAQHLAADIILYSW
jgi:hypothetical protein